MKLTIVPDDSFVAVDSDDSHRPLDLASCGIPSDVHALQWFDTKGWIEFDDPADPFLPKPLNQIIEALPQWADNCVAVFNAWTPPPLPPPKPKAEQPNTTGTQAA
jgi:hypothetical protein